MNPNMVAFITAVVVSILVQFVIHFVMPWIIQRIQREKARLTPKHFVPIPPQLSDN